MTEQLTSIGAWRPGTRAMPNEPFDGVPVGGFYTQEQLRRLAAYTASTW